MRSVGQHLSYFRKTWIVALARSDTFRLIPEAQVVMVCADNDRGYSVDGKPFAQLTDSIGEFLLARNISFISLAYPGSRSVGDKAYGNPHSISRAYFLALLLDILSRPFARLAGDRFGSVASLLVGSRSRLWCRVIRRCRARVVVLVGVDPDLSVAARKIGVTLLELQHGYRYESTDPLPRSYLARYHDELPGVLLSLDHYSLGAFREVAARGVDLRIVRNPWHELVADCGVATDIVRESVEQERRVLDVELSGKTVVVLAFTWGYEPWGHFAGVYPNGVFPEELFDVVARTPSVTWVIRPHPVHLRDPRCVESRAVIRELIVSSPNVSLLSDKEVPLPLLLERASGLMTTTSGSAAEAVEYGLPIMILDTSSSGANFRHSFRDEITSGTASLWTNSSADLIRWVSDLAISERQSASASPSSSSNTEIGRQSILDVIAEVL